MSILDNKIKELINELDYSDDKVVKTDRKSVEFIMHELVDFVLANVTPLYNSGEIKKNIAELKNCLKSFK